MKKILALSLLVISMAGGWVSVSALDGPDPPPRCIPKVNCPVG